MRDKFSNEILNHPLKKEIIITVIANKLVNQLGGSLITDIEKETVGVLCDIARAHSVICELFDLDGLWKFTLPPA